MIVEVAEQLAVLLEPLFEPGVVVGRELRDHSLHFRNQFLTVDVAHGQKPTYELHQSAPQGALSLFGGSPVGAGTDAISDARAGAR